MPASHNLSRYALEFWDVLDKCQQGLVLHIPCSESDARTLRMQFYGFQGAIRKALERGMKGESETMKARVEAVQDFYGQIQASVQPDGLHFLPRSQNKAATLLSKAVVLSPSNPEEALEKAQERLIAKIEDRAPDLDAEAAKILKRFNL